MSWWDTFTFLIKYIGSFPLQAAQRIYWVYLFSALGLGLLVYLRNAKVGRSFRGFWKFLFPKKIWREKSVWLEIPYFFLTRVFYLLALAPLLILVKPALSFEFQNLLIDWGGVKSWSSSQSWQASLIYTLAMLLTLDFSLYLMHYLQHKIKWMWEFHKTHHSAPVMTPLTVYRMHPVDDFFNLSLTALNLSLVDGLFRYYALYEVSLFQLWGLNLFILIYYVFGYNLRHSHIWLSYGPRVEKWLISPVQHQIHHSKDSKHFDKNFGFIFAFWDRFFKTLYVPQTKEKLVFGLNHDEHLKFSGLSDYFFYPFKKINLGLSLLLFSFFGFLGYLTYQRFSDPIKRTSVHLEEMTYKEVESALKSGITSVIIPTGGTEQNGPHMVLGKHNIVVRYTAQKIAERVGKTLVAPVMAYVPQGSINPPSGWMQFAGTLSLPEEIFQETLYYTAHSLKQHGFKKVVLMGDSLGNQLSLKKVSDRLNQEGEIEALYLENYYFQNGQWQYFYEQGESKASIGLHAGMRDTSEAYAVKRRAVRPYLFKVHDGVDPSYSGNPEKASVKLGRLMLELKIEAGVKQILEVQSRAPASDN